MDGGLDTSWRDYVDSYVEIVDDNDTNGDGLPDILNVPEPGAMVASVAGLGAVLALVGIRRTKRRGRGSRRARLPDRRFVRSVRTRDKTLGVG